MNKTQRDRLDRIYREYIDLDISGEEREAIGAAVDLWDRLPKTADGVAMIAGDQVRRVAIGPRGGVYREWLTVGPGSKAGRWWSDDDANSMGDSWEPWCDVSECYSTEEAALASKGADRD